MRREVEREGGRREERKEEGGRREGGGGKEGGRERDEWMDGRTDGLTNRRMDGWAEGGGRVGNLYCDLSMPDSII